MAAWVGGAGRRGGLPTLSSLPTPLFFSRTGPVEPIDWLEWQATWESHRLPEDQRIERSAGPRAHTLGRT